MTGTRFRTAVVIGACVMAVLTTVSAGANGATMPREGARRPMIKVDPTEGPPSSAVKLAARGFGDFERVQFVLIDSERGTERMLTIGADHNGFAQGESKVPPDATVGLQRMGVKGLSTGLRASTPFMVT